MQITRERIYRVNLGRYLSYAIGWTMRVWRDEPIDSEREFHPQRVTIDPDVADMIDRFIGTPTSQKDLAKAFLGLERVTAVEIVDLGGAGEVLYKDWP